MFPLLWSCRSVGWPTCIIEIGTILMAGHETTSSAMSWTLFGLCQNVGAQKKLREELLTLHTDDPTMDELKSLPYLDMVIRESLRLYSPVFVARRVVAKDTVLPMMDGSSIRCVWPRHSNTTILTRPSSPNCEQNSRRGQSDDPTLCDEYRQRSLGQRRSRIQVRYQPGFNGS